METRTAVVNLQPGAAIAVIRLSQYDTGIPLRFIVYDGSTPASFDSGTTVNLYTTRPSEVLVSVSGTLSGNVVSVTSILDMSREPGEMESELRFTKDSTIVGTANFTLSVERAAHHDTAIDATTEALERIAESIHADTVQSTTNATIANTAREQAVTSATTAATNANIAAKAAESAGKARDEAIEAAERATAAAGAFVIDDTLSVTGQAADAAKTGREINALNVSKADATAVTELRTDVDGMISLSDHVLIIRRSSDA